MTEYSGMNLFKDLLTMFVNMLRSMPVDFFGVQTSLFGLTASVMIITPIIATFIFSGKEK